MERIHATRGLDVMCNLSCQAAESRGASSHRHHPHRHGREIAALEVKLSKARQIKQGMMQELLTGRIRLI